MRLVDYAVFYAGLLLLLIPILFKQIKIFVIEWSGIIIIRLNISLYMCRTGFFFIFLLLLLYLFVPLIVSLVEGLEV